jgi:uncharacterized alpha-E superfamily protein
VVDLLLTDDTNPRSVIFQVRAIAEDIRALPDLPGAGVRSPQLRRALVLLNEVELAEIDLLCTPEVDGSRPRLEETLRRMGAALPALSESLANGYLNLATAPRHLRHDAPLRSPLPDGADGAESP